MLHEGRSELLTGDRAADARRVPARPARARHRARHRARAPAMRYRGSSTPASRTPTSTTCCATSCRCSMRSRAGPATPTSWPSASSCCSPLASRRSWRRARRAGSATTSAASRAPPGGVVCAGAARPGRSRSTSPRTSSWPPRWAARLPRLPAASERALRQAERAIADTVEHHAGVRSARGDRQVGSLRGGEQMGVRVLRGLEGDARAARRQGRQRRRDDAHPRGRAGPGRLHDHHRGLRGLHAHGPRFARRAGRAGRRGAGATRGAGGQAAGRSRGPAAGVGPLRGARVDAGDARHGAQPGARTTSRSQGLAARDRQRALRLGLLPALRADVRQRRAAASRASATRT